ncbi:MAG: urea transporter [Bacteroidetes bacterium]|nr:urea transporter [Bacteroidota bacterium]
MKKEQLKENISFYFEGAVNSYSQVFFSKNKIFAFIIIAATFLNPVSGVSGLISLFSALLFADRFGYSRVFIRDGTYGFNCLLTGLALGVYYEFSVAFFFVLIFASVMTLLMTVWLGVFLSNYNIPFLTLPFLFSTWIAVLSIRTFKAIELSERGIYVFNDVQNLGGVYLLKFYDQILNLNIPFILEVYLKSLGAVFFQYNIFAGFILMIGLLIYSRIAFTLSLLGFFSGYFFYFFQRAEFSDVYYSYIGFNFILTAIALGGFFYIPSRRTYFLVLITSPLVAVILSAFSYVFNIIQLPIYSLPFSLTVMLVIFAMNNRVMPTGISLVLNQQYSPENNLYKFANRAERFKKDTYYHFHLPFFGKWNISQGIDGKITHKEDWKYAWDFVVKDEYNKTYKYPGTAPEDFYCFNLPVISPAAGYVDEVVNDVDDNKIGEVNINENWGNTIIIKHDNFLYSKISHLKKNSIRLRKGDYVKRGDIIGLCGNSGRSPEPHLHFQIQSNNLIDGKTVKYPFSYYLLHKNGENIFRSFDYPEENETVQKITNTSLIKESFKFSPGRIMNFRITDEKGHTENIKLEVFVDAYNYPYIYCEKTKSFAYFINNETLHYFTDFTGDRNSFLYYFYIAANKILLGYYENIIINDKLPVGGIFSGPVRILQDFIAPFRIFLNADYSFSFREIDNDINPSEIIISTKAVTGYGKKIKRKLDFELVLNNNKLNKILISDGKKQISAQSIS